MTRWTVLMLIALAGCTATEPSPERSATSTTAPPTTSPTGASSSTASPTTAPVSSHLIELGSPESWTVLEVVDGDTLSVAGPDGEQRVRIVGINAPEQGECFFDEATEGLRALVAGAEVRLVRDVSATDRFDRLLRFVETTDGSGDEIGDGNGSVDVGAELVRSGLARSQRFEPDVSRNDRYDELQDEAQTAGRGLWAPDACGTPAIPAGSGETSIGVAVIGVEIEYDAPGDDNENLNEEWVRFVNQGDAALDLTGWQVADESSTHRYRFDELRLPPGGSVTLFTGCGADSATERHWCNEDSAVWNNSGDTVFLQDPSGNTVVAESYRG